MPTKCDELNELSRKIYYERAAYDERCLSFAQQFLDGLAAWLELKQALRVLPVERPQPEPGHSPVTPPAPDVAYTLAEAIQMQVDGRFVVRVELQLSNARDNFEVRLLSLDREFHLTLSNMDKTFRFEENSQYDVGEVYAAYFAGLSRRILHGHSDWLRKGQKVNPVDLHDVVSETPEAPEVPVA